MLILRSKGAGCSRRTQLWWTREALEDLEVDLEEDLEQFSNYYSNYYKLVAAQGIKTAPRQVRARVFEGPIP